MSYEDDTWRPHLRLYLLQALERSAGQTSHEHLLRDMMDQTGLRTSSAQLRAEVEWLRDAGLVRIDPCGEGWIVALREAGADLAQGRATRDGIARPRPGR